MTRYRELEDREKAIKEEIERIKKMKGEKEEERKGKGKIV